MKHLMKNATLRLAVICMCAFAGGFAGQVWSNKAEAQSQTSSKPLFFYGEDGQPRLQLGMYTDAGEKGLPLVGLSDNAGRLRMLFRLAGENQSPVIIMKDKGGHDRLVMGLNLSGETDAPFLSIVDADGKKQNIFGTY